MTCQSDAPRHGRVFALDHQLVDLGEEGTIVRAQRMTNQARHDPVAIGDVGLFQRTLETGLERQVDRGVVRHHSQAAIAFLHPRDEAIQRRLEQRLGISLLLVAVLLDDRFDAVAMENLLHGGRWDEIGGAVFGFEKTEAFVCRLDGALNARRVGANILLQLGQKRVVLQHRFGSVGGRERHYTDSAWGTPIVR